MFKTADVKGRRAVLGTDSHDADFPVLDARSLILMTWRNQSACLDEEPELFFPIGNTGLALVQIEEGKAVCRRCEVIEACLSWAIQSDQTAGVWGGMSEDERTALKRRDARSRRADQAAHRH